MARNPDKRRCEQPGCKAWAMHGTERCYAHRKRVAAEGAPDVDPVARATKRLLRVCRRRVAHLSDDLTVLDEELRQLCAARELMAAWVDELGAQGWESCTPVQVLRAWSDSSRQVVQLVRARRALAGVGEGALLMQEAYAVVESLPGVRLLT